MSSWPPSTIYFHMEGEDAALQPWKVREGMLVTTTTWDHDKQHLSVELRPGYYAAVVALSSALEQTLEVLGDAHNDRGTPQPQPLAKLLRAKERAEAVLYRYGST